MAPSTVTTLVMIAFAAFVLTWAGYTWFGSWQPEPRRVRILADRQSSIDQEHEAAVLELRRAIAAYERNARRRAHRDLP